jgi:hypothetical protein
MILIFYIMNQAMNNGFIFRDYGDWFLFHRYFMGQLGTLEPVRLSLANMTTTTTSTTTTTQLPATSSDTNATTTQLPATSSLQPATITSQQPDTSSS